MQDIQGPKIRTGIADEGTVFHPTEKVDITNSKSISNSSSLFINYENLFNDIKIGERVFIDDGQIVLRIESLEGSTMKASVEIGG